MNDAYAEQIVLELRRIAGELEKLNTRAYEMSDHAFAISEAVSQAAATLPSDEEV